MALVRGPEPDGEPASADGPGADAQLLPLSNELITTVLRERGYRYFIDSDGDVGGHWDNTLIYFFRLGEHQEMLQVRAMARTMFGIDEVPRLYAFCNSWNHDKLWPKAYVHVGDDGAAGVYGEVTTDLEKGVTAAQLDQLIACGISTGCALADAVAALP
jgi:Putative bacterial sensory transduction regulator